ncbi:hypothetical protein DIPPA_34219 [Diplonema papillatum]|nr:hypothetical protein DIPPA_34219 [Diplonema papillatum]
MAQRIEVLKSHVARGLEVEFVYDISSFNAYRAHKRVDLVFGDLPSVPLRYRPILLGGLFRALVPDVNYASKLPDGTPFVQYGPVPWDASMPKARDTKVETFASMLPGITLKAREGCHEVTRSLRAGAPVMHAMRLCASAGAGQGRAVCEEFMALYHVRNLAMLPGDTAAAAAKFGLADGKKALLASTQAAISADDVAGVPTFIIRHPDRAPVSFFGVDRMPLMHQYFNDMFKLNLSRDDIARIHKLRVTGDGSLLSRADTPMLPGAALVVYHHIASPWSFFAVEQAEALRRAFPALRVGYRAADLAAVQREAGVNPSVLKGEVPPTRSGRSPPQCKRLALGGTGCRHPCTRTRRQGLQEKRGVSFFGVDRMPLMHQYFNDMFKLNLSRDDIARIHKLRVTGDGSLLSRADTPMLPGAALVVYHHIASPWSFFAVEQAEALRRAFPALRVDYRAADLAAVQREASVNPSVLKGEVPPTRSGRSPPQCKRLALGGTGCRHPCTRTRRQGLQEKRGGVRVSFFGVDRMPLMHQYFNDMFKLNLSTDDIARIHKLRVTGDGSLLSRADTPMLPGAALVVYHHIASPWSFFAVEQAEALWRAFPALRVGYRAADLAAVQREAGVNPSVLKGEVPPTRSGRSPPQCKRWALGGTGCRHPCTRTRRQGLQEKRGGVRVSFFGVDRMPLMHQYFSDMFKLNLSTDDIARIHKLRVTGDGSLLSRADTPMLPGAALVVYHHIASPWSFFAVEQAEALRRAFPALRVDYRAADLAAVQREAGVNPSVLQAKFPNKKRMLAAEVQRWARWHGLPALHENATGRTMGLDEYVDPQQGAAHMRLAAACPERTGEVYRSYWIDGSVEAALAPAAGGGGAADVLRRNTEEALRLGASRLPLIDVPSTECALSADFQNPLAFYMAVDYLCGWRPSVVE